MPSETAASSWHSFSRYKGNNGSVEIYFMQETQRTEVFHKVMIDFSNERNTLP